MQRYMLKPISSLLVQLEVSLEILEVVAYVLFKRVRLLLMVMVILIPISPVTVSDEHSEHPCLPFVAVLVCHATCSSRFLNWVNSSRECRSVP